ncbi:T9SS type A sorting domain-containing protein [bacterium SCSIO 12741]|nr:T9SS type A sorting domain-containing protein [bacterium SCSIO 12741]
MRNFTLISLLLLFQSAVFAANVTVNGTVSIRGTLMTSQAVYLTDSATGTQVLVFTNSAGQFSGTVNTGSHTAGRINIQYRNCSGISLKDTLGRYSVGNHTLGPFHLERCQNPPPPPYKVHYTGRVKDLPSELYAVLVKGPVAGRIESTDANEQYSGYFWASQKTGTFYAYHIDCHGDTIYSPTYTYVYQKDTSFVIKDFEHCENPPYVLAEGLLTDQMTSGVQMDFSTDGFQQVVKTSYTNNQGFARDTFAITPRSRGVLSLRYADCQGNIIQDTLHYGGSKGYRIRFNTPYCPDTLPIRISGNIHTQGGFAQDAHVVIMEWDSVSKTILATDTLKHIQKQFQYDTQDTTKVFLIQAFLDPADSESGNYFPTYADSSIYWSQAKVIKSNSSRNIQRDVYLVPVASAQGTGEILVEVMDHTTNPNSPAAGIQVYMLGANQQPESFGISNPSGQHTFNSVVPGDHWIYAEVNGKVTVPVKVSLSLPTDMAKKVEIQIGGDTVQGSEGVLAVLEYAGNSSLRTYPMPTRDRFYVEFPNESRTGSLVVRDVSGRLLYQKDFENQSALEVEVASWQPGWYFGSVETDRGLEEFKLLVQ